MMKLKDLLKNVTIVKAFNIDENQFIDTIEFDSRKVSENSLFVAIKGVQNDGHDYIHQVVQSGCKIIVCEVLPENISQDTAFIQVENSAETLGLLGGNFYNNPSKNIKVIGVTGTNGKTSTTSILYQLFKLLGYKVGLISTIKIVIDGEETPATHTTPDAISVQKNIAEMVAKGCSHCFMEVSSHAIEQRRIAGIEFELGLFTNITHEHLDYHKTFKNYIEAKKLFFDHLPKAATALYNADDRNGKVMMQNTVATVKSFGLKTPSDYNARIKSSDITSMSVDIDGNVIETLLSGEFNAYNILSSYAIAMELGEDKMTVLVNLSKVEPIEGRIDTVVSPFKNVTGVVDYAHSPDAVEKILSELKKNIKKNKLYTVIGCGGNRDVLKRPKMAKIACKYSDKVILTSDNPRDEEPLDIINDMKVGMEHEDVKKCLTVVDRAEAIKTASMLVEENDVIAVLGKGHEKYQETKGERKHFDDKEELIKNFKEQNL